MGKATAALVAAEQKPEQLGVAPASMPAAGAILVALRATCRTLRAFASTHDALGSALSAELLRAAACTIEAATAVSCAGAMAAIPRRRQRRHGGRGRVRSAPESLESLDGCTSSASSVASPLSCCGCHGKEAEDLESTRALCEVFDIASRDEFLLHLESKTYRFYIVWTPKMSCFRRRSCC